MICVNTLIAPLKLYKVANSDRYYMYSIRLSSGLLPRQHNCTATMNVSTYRAGPPGPKGPVGPPGPSGQNVSSLTVHWCNGVSLLNLTLSDLLQICFCHFEFPIWCNTGETWSSWNTGPCGAKGRARGESECTQSYIVFRLLFSCNSETCLWLFRVL